MVEVKTPLSPDTDMSASALADRSEVSLTKGQLQDGDSSQESERKLTPYERLSYDLSNDKRCLKEITLGKRIGFYRIRGELGNGNFSQVKMGIHSLTKGT